MNQAVFLIKNEMEESVFYMDKINIAVCDDDPAFRQMLVCELKNYAENSDINMIISSFSNGLELMISEVRYSLIFLDYKMGIMNGLETAKKLRHKGITCPIIFVTSFNEIVYDVFEVNAFRFITKPIEPEVLKKALDDFVEQHKKRKIISFTSNGSAVSIPSDEIMFVEGKGRGCVVHTEREAYPVLQVMSLFAEALPADSFFKCHRSYIVNFKYVREFSEHSITLNNGDIIKLDRAKAAALKIARDEFLEHCI